MEVFLLLFIFWKPIYYGVRAVIATVQKNSVEANARMTQVGDWFGALWKMIAPTDL